MDPQAKDVDTYVEFAKMKGMQINYVVDTHIQADHLSSGTRLAQDVDAVLHANRTGRVQ